PDRAGSAAAGVFDGIETLVNNVITSVRQLLLHPIDTLTTLGREAKALARYLWETPFEQIKSDISDLVRAFWLNRACEIAEMHSVNYFELKTERGREVVHAERVAHLGGEVA